jgi:hypothetical protein
MLLEGWNSLEATLMINQDKFINVNYLDDDRSYNGEKD